MIQGPDGWIDATDPSIRTTDLASGRPVRPCTALCTWRLGGSVIKEWVGGGAVPGTQELRLPGTPMTQELRLPVPVSGPCLIASRYLSLDPVS